MQIFRPPFIHVVRCRRLAMRRRKCNKNALIQIFLEFLNLFPNGYFTSDCKKKHKHEMIIDWHMQRQNCADLRERSFSFARRNSPRCHRKTSAMFKDQHSQSHNHTHAHTNLLHTVRVLITGGHHRFTDCGYG